MNRVPLEHRGGRAFFQLPKAVISSEEDYFSCLRSLKPLFGEEDFKEATPGFYINCIGNTLRLECYSINTKKTREVIENFVKKNDDKISLIRFEGLDENSSFDLDSYPAERKSKILQLRNCFDASTQIVLDLLDKIGIEKTRALFNEYNQFIPLGKLPKEFFEPEFSKNSNFYKNLNSNEVDQFWQALLFYQPEIQALGIHFPYNMLLVADGPFNLLPIQKI